MQVIWYKKAIGMFDEIMEYGIAAFGERTAYQLYRKVKEYEVLLRNNPLIGGIEPLLAGRKYEYRTLVVHKHYKLVYCVNEDKVNIVAFWDCRQAPEKLGNILL